MKPKTNNLKISAMITEEEKALLEKYAIENDLNISQVIRKALRLLLTEQK